LLVEIKKKGGEYIAKNPYIAFIAGLAILFGLLLILSAGLALVEATENIWDDIIWSSGQFFFSDAIVIFVPIPLAGGLGIGLTFGGPIYLGKG